MAWGEFHMLTGIALHEAAHGRWWLALPLAVLSHWPLDDLNIGAVGRIYHGTGKGFLNVIVWLARVPIIAAISYLFYDDHYRLICGLTAWLVLDHEWALNIFGYHGYGLHAHMWPAWLYDERGLIPWFIAFGLLIAILLLSI